MYGLRSSPGPFGISDILFVYRATSAFKDAFFTFDVVPMSGMLWDSSSTMMEASTSPVSTRLRRI